MYNKISNYNNGKIYIIKFINKKDNHIYIGSTINNLKHRFSNHKSSRLFKRNKTSLSKYIESKYNNNWNNCYIQLLLNFPCNSRKELEKKEFQIINKFYKNKNFKLLNINGLYKNKKK